jgi:hypothetical protein
VRVIGVDEHRWSHTHRTGDDGYVTVIIDLTPVLEGTGRVQLLDLVAGWLANQSPQFRDQVQRTWSMQVSVRIQVVRYACRCADRVHDFITQKVGSPTRR